MLAASNASLNDFFWQVTGCESMRSFMRLDWCGLGPIVEAGASVPSDSGGVAAL
jgi:hypothetical protein